MKLITYFYLLLLPLFFIAHCYSCPNCVGRVTESTPPFFSDDFYKPESTDDEEIISMESNEQSKKEVS